MYRSQCKKSMLEGQDTEWLSEFLTSGKTVSMITMSMPGYCSCIEDTEDFICSFIFAYV